MLKNNNIDAFFALVRAGLWETDVRLLPYGVIDFKEIYRLAQEQAVVGLVAAGIEHIIDVKIPKEDALLIAGSTMQMEQRNTAMNSFIAVIVEKMRNEGINTVLVKGQGIAQCYARPLWRSCGDVDFLFDSENYEKAKDYLIPLAESVDQEDIYCRHIGMTISPWLVEVHGSLRTELSFRIDKYLDYLLKDVFLNSHVRVWGNGNTNVLLPSIENDIIFIFTHFLKHFYKGGLGIRQICDWCRLVWSFQKEIDRTLLEDMLKTMRLTAAWSAFSAFAIEYLGMPEEKMPLHSCDLKWKKKAKLINKYLLRVGNFGNNRSTSYYKYPFIIRKACSFGTRINDIVHHATIFPYDSWRFLFGITFNGFRSALKGIG